MAIKNWLIRLNKCLWFLTSQDLIVPTSIVGDNAGRGTISCDGNITLFVTESVLIVAILLPPEYTVFALRQRPTARRDDESARRPDDWIPRRNILEHFYIFSTLKNIDIIFKNEISLILTLYQLNAFLLWELQFFVCSLATLAVVARQRNRQVDASKNILA